MDNMNAPEKKPEKKGGVGSVLKMIFVHNIGLKLLAIGLAAVLVVLAVAL